MLKIIAATLIVNLFLSVADKFFNNSQASRWSFNLVQAIVLLQMDDFS